MAIEDPQVEIAATTTAQPPPEPTEQFQRMGDNLLAEMGRMEQSGDMNGLRDLMAEDCPLISANQPLQDKMSATQKKILRDLLREMHLAEVSRDADSSGDGGLYAEDPEMDIPASRIPVGSPMPVPEESTRGIGR
jgi:hypothetical protein